MNASGLLIPHHCGVSSLFGFPPTREQRIMAATLSIGGRGIASHRTAAELWGAWRPDDGDSVDIIVGDRFSQRSLDGVTVHRPRDIEDIAPIRRNGIRVTTASRTLIDLGAVAPHGLASATERMLIAGHVTRDHLRRAVARHSERGRAGVGPMRRLLATWPYSDRPPDSVLEMHMDRVLARHALPPHLTQIPVGPFFVDLGWPEWKVAGELDGWGKYEQLSQFRRQIRRDSFLQINGWLVIHFTWHDVTRKERSVIHELRQALLSRGWTP